MKTNNKGFTLIELLVVIAIITILATISIPQFAKYRVRAYNVVALSDLRNFKVDLEAYYTDVGHLGYPPGLTGDTANNKWYTSDDVASALDDETWDSSLSFIPSNRVDVYYDVSTDRTHQVYAVGTKHLNGDTMYASTSHSSRIYMQSNPDAIGLGGASAVTAIGVTMPDAGGGTGDESATYKDSWFTSTGGWKAI